MREIFEGVYELKGRILTKNFDKGKKVYGEKLIQINGKEYRSWNPNRSKLCAAIKCGLKTMPIKKGGTVLYLGAATGTTVSHLSDIVGKKGEIYAVEVAPHSMKQLLQLCETRENIIPILADARNPAEYKKVGKVDVVYEDVSHPEQASIMNKNSIFLEKKGYGLFAIKSQSIDVVKSPLQVFKEVEKELSEKYKIKEKIDIERYEKAHRFLVLRKRE